jgi:pyruvate formate lyase activating enzyme
LENITRLNQRGIPFIIRTPVIPGVNDSAEMLAPIARFLSGMKNLMYYELLNYNPLGGYKYKGLKMQYINKKPLEPEKMEKLVSAAQAFGIEARCA